MVRSRRQEEEGVHDHPLDTVAGIGKDIGK
jgi:hypothetical protein